MLQSLSIDQKYITYMAKKVKDLKNDNIERTPIIAVMGHVDHGKTSLLDALRDTSVQEGEVGGITQNTRAHVVEKGNYRFTFIDTPGHEAFSGMRSRGAKVTDIVMLVVAADDGVKPQTIESIKFAQEANVPIVVAINKMDLPGANPAKVKQELSQYNVLVEEFGGDVMVVEVSAVKREGLDSLLETLGLQAEILELKPTKVEEGNALGVVLESHLDNSLGPVSLILLKGGGLEENNYILTENKVTKVRSLLDENQSQIKKASEGAPVWVIGLDEVLGTGERVLFFENEKDAQRKFKSIQKGESQVAPAEEAEEIDDSDLLAMLIGEEEQEEGIKKLNVILKTDTKGTLEAVSEQLEDLSDEEVRVNILEAATGDITLKDIELAKTSRAIVLGFQVGIGPNVEKIAKRDRVLYRLYDVIYSLVDEVAIALDSLVEPEEEEVEISRARVKQVFVLSNGQIVAGSEVIKGVVIKGYSAFVERDGEEIGRGKITSLKQSKEEVREVKKGQECGILMEPQVELEEGDEIVCYKVEKL